MQSALQAQWLKLRLLPHYFWVGMILLLLLVALFRVSMPRSFPDAWIVNDVTALVPGRSDIEPVQVRLPHILDDQPPAWWNRVAYEFTLPVSMADQARPSPRLGMLMPRVGTRFRVFLNDQEIYDVGWYAPSDRTLLSGWFPYLIRLPEGLLHEAAAGNTLRIEVQGQLLERSGLWPVMIGHYDTLNARYREIHLWQVTGTWVMVVTSILMGLLAFFLWISLKERLFLLISLASLAHFVRLILSVVIELPWGFELYFYLHRLAFTLYVGLFFLLIDELFGTHDPWVRRMARLTMVAGAVWLLFTVVSANYDYYRIWAGWLAASAAFCLVWVIVKVMALKRFTDDHKLVAWVAGFTLLTGIRDFLVIQLNFPGDADIRWMSVGSLALMLTLGWVLVQRASEAAQEVHRLNQTLAQKVADRESELRQAFEQLRLSEQQRAIEGERRRLVRDMHDGLGSQLVQTLNTVRSLQAGVDQGAIAAMIQNALEELRMTLDSLEPMEGDLTTILGTFRQRIAPALTSAGIELIWHIEEVPALQRLDAQGVMHLFRCMQEVFANILKHSRASRVIVRTSSSPEAIFLFVEDNGVGLDEQMPDFCPGRGLGNLRVRAQSIGANIRFFNTFPGTGVEFRFPIHTEPDPSPA
jgi:signal transduction histidine kinase